MNRYYICIHIVSHFFIDQNKTVFRTVVTNDSVCFEGEFKNTTQILESIKITQNNSCKPFQKHITFDTCNYTTDGLVPPGWYLLN